MSFVGCFAVDKANGQKTFCGWVQNQYQGVKPAVAGLWSAEISRKFNCDSSVVWRVSDGSEAMFFIVPHKVCQGIEVAKKRCPRDFYLRCCGVATGMLSANR